MPEGDVVWRTANRLRAALAGRVLVTSDLRWPSLATTDLRGRQVLDVASVGKHLLTRLEGELTLYSHLKMEGSWHLARTGQPWRKRPESGIRAVLANVEWTAIGHRLGRLELVETRAEDRLVGHLGPDVLGPTWDPAEARRRLLAAPGRPIGEALLDQRVLAGVGTFFMAETCFLRGVSPWTPVAEAGDLDRLLTLVHRLLTMSATSGLQTTTGDTRKGQEEYVHSRSGRPCRRCGTTIRVASIGSPPQERPAFYCPRCQPGPAPDRDRPPPRPLGATRPRR